MYFSNNRASAADLEEEFTNRLRESGSKVTSRTIRHASKTFDEIIVQDAHFGTLLTKIKKAYDTYIRCKCGELQSDNELPTYDDLKTKIKLCEGIITEKNSVIKTLEDEFLNMRAEMEKAYIEERQTKDSIIHDLKNRIDVLNKQLTDVKKENDELKSNAEKQHDDHGKEDEIRNLIHDNTILNDE
jgi:predicted RNase H-like nuclease (RuvC/YqgF family)